ncbi:MAG: sulfatase-like hydrolase/transferase [Pseudomonadota bacterium]
MAVREPVSVVLAVLSLAMAGCDDDERGGPAAAVSSPPSDGPSAPQEAAPALATPAPLHGRARNAVVILIDTLRADALDHAATPNVDALAARGLVIERAWSTSTWTVPAVVSLFTGSFLRTHGWDLPTGDMKQRPALPPLPTLAEVLHEAGFQTHGLYANGYLAAELGFSRGFDEWRRSADRRMPQQVAEHVRAWQADTQRHFLYLHLLGIHSGLSPSAEAQERHHLDPAWFTERVGLLIGRAKRNEPGARDAYRDAYQAVVEDLDGILGEILAGLAPVQDETLIVLLSDHGEELGETGVFGHGWSVAEALTHIPVIAAGPGIPHAYRPTGSLAEVTDLVTDALGVEHAWPVQSPYEGPLASERHGKLAILADGRFKGAWSGAERTLVDLQADPAGLQATAEGGAEVDAALREWRAATPEGAPLTGSVELDPRTIEALKALGYIE